MIGLFNDCFPPIMDGVSVTTRNYAYWLNRRRGDVCVITPQAPEADDNDGYPVYRYLSMPIPMRKPYRLGVPHIDRSFHKKIGKIDFALVHAHCPFSSGLVAKQISREQGAPLVATFHSKYRTDFARVIHNRIMLDYLTRNIIDFYEQADEVWIPQAAVEETLREYGYQGRVEVVDNGNDFAGTPYDDDIQRKAKIDLGLNPDIPLLLFVGQHIWEKNTRFLLQAVSKLRRGTYQMRFVGTGYAADDMRKFAADLGLNAAVAQTGQPSVAFDGPVYDREQMRRYYTAADLFLFPSLYDNAPLVVREAAAMHTPSVLLEGSTAGEIISNGENGFLTPNDVDCYAAKVAELIASPTLRHKAGEGAAQTLARSWEDIAGEVNDRYNSLIARKKKKEAAHFS